MATVCLPHRVKFETRASKKQNSSKLCCNSSYPCRFRSEGAFLLIRRTSAYASCGHKIEITSPTKCPCALLFLTSPRASLTLS
jgi:hypothetical protein